MHHDLIRQILSEMGQQRGCHKSFCPSEAARRLVAQNPQLGNWRDWMEDIRANARRLEREGKLEFLQQGKRISPKPGDFSGPIRLRWLVSPQAASLQEGLRLDGAIEKSNHVKEERRRKAD